MKKSSKIPISIFHLNPRPVLELVFCGLDLHLTALVNRILIATTIMVIMVKMTMMMIIMVIGEDDHDNHDVCHHADDKNL